MRSPAAALAVLTEAAQAAEDTLARGADAVAALDRVAQALEEARQALDAVAPSPPPLAEVPPPAPVVALPDPPVGGRPEVVLPPVRMPWMLILACPGDRSKASALARVLGVDGVTARMAALARAPRVVLRSETVHELTRKAEQLRSELTLPAVVASREQLLQIAAPDVVLEGRSPDGLLVSAAWPWTAEAPVSPPADARVLAQDGVMLAVPGEVVVRRYRVGRSLARGRRQDKVLRLASEQRHRVVDLHGPGLFARVVAGVTDTSALPGHDPRSGLRAVQGLLDHVDNWLPEAVVQGERTVAPGSAPTMPEGHDGAAPIEASAWPLWEEHSRLCRLLAGLPADDVPAHRV